VFHLGSPFSALTLAHALVAGLYRSAATLGMCAPSHSREKLKTGRETGPDAPFMRSYRMSGGGCSRRQSPMLYGRWNRPTSTPLSRMWPFIAAIRSARVASGPSVSLVSSANSSQV